MQILLPLAAPLEEKKGAGVPEDLRGGTALEDERGIPAGRVYNVRTARSGRATI
jgi:hypothetical protein